MSEQEEGTPRAPPRITRFGRLGARMATLVVAAMLPIGILSVIQTSNLRSEAIQRGEMALMGQTVQAAAPLIRVIRDAEVTARVLAQSMNGLARLPADCRARMARVQQSEPAYSLVAFIPPDGLMKCSSTGAEYDFSQSPIFSRIIKAREPQFVVNRQGPVSKTSVLGIIHPVINRDGEVTGIISISIPHTRLPEVADVRGPDRSLVDPVALLTFDGEGEILTASVDLSDAPQRVPRDRSLASLATGEATTFTTRSVTGFRRNYSVVPIAKGLYLLGSWRTEDQGSAFTLAASPYLLPGLMWLSGFVVALMAAEFLMTRHVRALERSMTAFAGGNRIPTRLDLAHAPDEVRRLGWSYETMIEIVQRDEAELENLLRQKQGLLREVHHRTGNSLQLIASLIRLHLRQDPSPDARELLTTLHDRVMLLATVHLGLYQSADQIDVNMADLLRHVVGQLKSLAERAGRTVDFETDMDAVRLTPDQAVPLSLLVAELLTGLSTMMHATEGDPGALRAAVSLKRAGPSEASLVVEMPLPDNGAQAVAGRTVPGHIGAQLVQAFASQLGGVATRDQSDGLSVFRLSFPIR